MCRSNGSRSGSEFMLYPLAIKASSHERPLPSSTTIVPPSDHRPPPFIHPALFDPRYPLSSPPLPLMSNADSSVHDEVYTLEELAFLLNYTNHFEGLKDLPRVQLPASAGPSSADFGASTARHNEVCPPVVSLHMHVVIVPAQDAAIPPADSKPVRGVLAAPSRVREHSSRTSRVRCVYVGLARLPAPRGTIGVRVLVSAAFSASLFYRIFVRCFQPLVDRIRRWCEARGAVVQAF